VVGNDLRGCDGLLCYGMNLPQGNGARDGSDKAVASAGDIGHIPRAGLPVAKRLAKADQLRPKTALVDDDVRPGVRHQVALADDFARTFDQQDQDIERAAAQSKRNVSLIKKPFCSKQAKRAE